MLVVKNGTLTVANVAPVVTVTSPLTGALFIVGTTVTVTASLFDAGSNDTFTASTCTFSLDGGCARRRTGGDDVQQGEPVRRGRRLHRHGDRHR